MSKIEQNGGQDPLFIDDSTAQKRERLWTKDFVASWFIRFLTTTVFLMLLAVIPSYCMDVYGASTGEAGLVSGSFVVAATVSRIFSGKGVNSIGHKKSLMIFGALFVVGSLGYLLPLGFWPLFALRVVHGFIFGWFSTALTVVGAEVLPQSRIAEGMGYYALASCVAVGQFVAVLLYQTFEPGVCFLAVVAICVADLFCCWVVKVKEPSIPGVRDDEKSKQGKQKGFAFADYFEKGAVVLAIMGGISTALYSSVTAFIAPYSETLGLGVVSSVFFVVYTVVVFAVKPPLGRAMDKGYEKPIVLGGFIAFMVSYVLLFALKDSIGLFAAAAILGVGFSGANSSLLAILVKELPQDRISVTTSTFYLFVDAGMGLGPGIMGTLVPSLGYSGMYLTAAVVSAILAVCYFFYNGAKAKERA